LPLAAKAKLRVGRYLARGIHRPYVACTLCLTTDHVRARCPLDFELDAMSRRGLGVTGSAVCGPGAPQRAESAVSPLPFIGGEGRQGLEQVPASAEMAFGEKLLGGSSGPSESWEGIRLLDPSPRGSHRDFRLGGESPLPPPGGESWWSRPGMGRPLLGPILLGGSPCLWRLRRAIVPVGGVGRKTWAADLSGTQVFGVRCAG